MLAWLISLGEMAAFIFLGIALIFAIKDYRNEKAKPTIYYSIRKQFAKIKFVPATAVLVYRGNNQWTEIKRDRLNDKYEVEYESHFLGPDIERHIHTKAYKTVHREDAMRSQYEIKVDGCPYWLVSEEHTEKTLPVYYNPNFPMEIYLAEDVKKGLTWTDEDEKKMQKQALQPSKWAIIFYITIMTAIFIHLKFF